MNQDRRASRRLPANLAVRWEGSSGTVGCRIEDISVDGCFVNTLGMAALGEAITLEFGECSRVNGEVTSYLPGMGFGLAFKFISVEEEIAVRRLLTSLTIELLSPESLRSPARDLRA